MSEKLGVDGNLYNILDKYFEYTKKRIEDEFDSPFKDYRNNNQEERTTNT